MRRRKHYEDSRCRIRKLVLSVIVTLVWTVSLHAQAPDTIWTATIGGDLNDAMVSVAEMPDGGFVFGGWTNSFGKGLEDVWVIRTDVNGDTLWTRVFGGERFDSGHSISAVSSGGSIVAGQTYSFGHLNKADFWLIRLDDSGDTLWTRIIGGSRHDWAEYVTETTDGGFIVAGGTYSFGNGESDVWLVRLDSFGDTLWTRTYGGEEIDWAESVHETSDGGFILSGSTNRNGDRNGWLIRTDINGDSLWTRSFGDTLTDSFHPVKEVSNGDFIMGGFSHRSGKGDEAWLIRTDDSGNLLWEKTFGDNGGDRIYDIEEMADGGFMVLAWTRSFGSGEHDIWLLRTDENGEILKSKFYGGELSDVAFSFQQTHDNGLILAGFTKSNGNGQSDAWLLKITPTLPVSVIIADSVWIDSDGDGYSDGQLDGTESYNPDFDIISYIWTINDSVIGTSAQITALLPIGLSQVNLTVSDENGFANSATKDITVVLGAHMSVVPDTIDFGNVLVGRSNCNKSILISNNGNTDLVINEIRFSDLSFGYGPCLTSIGNNPDSLIVIPPDGSIGLTLSFAPDSVKVYSDTLTLLTNDALNLESIVILRGNGVAGFQSVSSSLLDFGDVIVGESKSDTFSVTNIGIVTILVGVVIPETEYFHTYPYYEEIAPGHSLIVPVDFSPPVAAQYTDRIIIDGEAGMDTINLTANGIILGIENEDILPDKIFLHQNYPNPFNPVTLIKYDIPYQAKVEITIYNLLGEKVATLVSEVQKAGYHSVTWNANNMASGVYIYSFQANPTSVRRAGKFIQTKKMVLLK